MHCSDWPARHGARSTFEVEDDGWMPIRKGKSWIKNEEGWFPKDILGGRHQERREWMLRRQLQEGATQ